MSRPYAAYLRVYEPLAVFGDPVDPRLAAATRAAELTRASAAERERSMWFASQFASPPRLLPAELADGRPSPNRYTDVLVLSPDEVPATDGVTVGPGPLVCPLEVRARSAAALASFLSDAHPVMRTQLLERSGATMDAARAKTTAALREVPSSALHVLSVSWSIPLPWFTIVDPKQRRLVLGEGTDDPRRELSWRVAMADARRRVAEARELAESTIGDDGPTQVLADTDRWLANFHEHSAVELDYGGLVQILPDGVLAADTSDEEVHGILDALRTGDARTLAELFRGLRDYWGMVAAQERAN